MRELSLANFFFFSRLFFFFYRGCAAGRRCAAQGTAVRCGTPAAPVFFCFVCFFCFCFFSRLGRRCAARGTAARRKAPLRGGGRLRRPSFFFFFFAAAPRVTLRVTPRNAAARREALLRSAGHRYAVRDAYGARHAPETAAYGRFFAPAAPRLCRGAPQILQTGLKTFPLPQCIILQNFMSFRPVV